MEEFDVTIMKQRLFHRIALVVIFTMCILSGCMGTIEHGKKSQPRTTSPVPKPTSPAQVNQVPIEDEIISKGMEDSKKAPAPPKDDPALEVEALLAQPYVDPLTRYLKRHADSGMILPFKMDLWKRAADCLN